MSFKKLGLSDALLKAISKKGYTTPSPIQEKAIPKILEGRDVLASAQTGTGKTAGFTLPMLEKMIVSPSLHKRPIRALILTPTRELAAQILDDVKAYSQFIDIRSMVIFGGVNANPQIRTLKQGVDVLVATPGRLLDLHNQGYISFSKTEFLVLDEADRMLDMGFLRDIKKVLALLPQKRQNLLFSATFSKDIKKLAGSFLNNPVLVEATPENTTAEKVNQTIYRTNKGAKTELVIKLITEGNWEQVLIFTRTKHGANKLSQKLEKAKISSAAIHGNKSQGARTKALAGFKSGKVRVLVATDIAARGLDIPLLPYVINYELPNIPEDYVHRIGRTGRAGASGDAISIVSVDEFEYVRGIEKLLGSKLDSIILEGFEPTDNLQDILDKKAANKAAHKRNNPRNRNAGGKGKNNSNSNSGNRNRERGRGNR
ncbi:ATP-dependent RNA helicase RhlE [Patiriisocius marinistellae]|uniref:DEAD-box ATP-dependent RNA helicase RhpA n=1 Tax=Patiriisocius marinistellae TaxID=2494560 RepID=A0A5J4G0Y0_9FLAO|nr:DEAD/DEAH box helicase [Patiriisocius marinistellae]GEQ86005.1 ATP-dependent RNA helicase RhlE [Patiriisocius marinistellae]